MYVEYNSEVLVQSGGAAVLQLGRAVDDELVVIYLLRSRRGMKGGHAGDAIVNAVDVG